jgi:hypothetical protein
MPFTAALLVATKTIPKNLLRGLLVRPGLAARFAPVLGAVQFAATMLTAALLNLFGQIGIDFLQQLR